MSQRRKQDRPEGLEERRRLYAVDAPPVAATAPGDLEGRNGIPVGPAKYRRFRLRMEANGRVVIPAELRALWGASDGAELFARFNNGELVLTTPLNGAKLAQAMIAPFRREGVDEVAEFLKSRPAMWGETDE